VEIVRGVDRVVPLGYVESHERGSPSGDIRPDK
jgi:hypothetical protein